MRSMTCAPSVLRVKRFKLTAATLARHGDPHVRDDRAVRCGAGDVSIGGQYSLLEASFERLPRHRECLRAGRSPLRRLGECLALIRA
jgi:hypothetical protein